MVLGSSHFLLMSKSCLLALKVVKIYLKESILVSKGCNLWQTRKSQFCKLSMSVSLSGNGLLGQAFLEPILSGLDLPKLSFLVSKFSSNALKEFVFLLLQGSISSTFYSQLLRPLSQNHKKIVNSSSFFALSESACIKSCT